MNEWWSALDVVSKTYWAIALISSLVFVVLLFMTFLGGDVGDDVDGDLGEDSGMGFQFFTLKNLTGFFVIFSWSGIASIQFGNSFGVTLGISVVCGLIMMTIMAMLFYFMSKLADEGTLKIQNAIGVIGEVYLTVGKNRSKIGKIQIKVQGGLRELDALTDEDEDLPMTTVIRVKDVIGDELLLIEKVTN